MAVENRVREHENVAFASAVAVAIGSGLAFGVLLDETGGLEFIAGLYGQEGTSAGWLFHLVHSAFAGVFFLAVVTTLARIDSTLTRGGSLGFPLVMGVAGVVYGVFLWGLVVPIVLPVWEPAGLELPLPFVHRPSLWGFAAFGGMLGLGYALAFSSLTRVRFISAGTGDN